MTPARDRAPAVLAALSLAMLLPLWLPSRVPYVDFPCRADDLYVLSELLDPGSPLQRGYRVESWLHPKMAARLALVPLTWLVGADAALRAMYSAYLLAVPAALAFALRAMGRSLWPVLLVFPVLHSFPMLYGFGLFCLGTAVVLACYAAFERLGAADSPSHWAAFSGLALLASLVHLQAYLVWVVTGGLLALVGLLAGKRSGRQTLALLSTLLVGSPPFLHFLLGAFRSGSEQAGRPLVGWNPSLGHRLSELATHLGAVWTDGLDGLVVLGFGALALLALVSAARQLGRPRGREQLWAWRWFFVLLSFGGGALLLPEIFGPQSFVASRFPSLAALSLPLAVASAPIVADRRFVAAAVALAGLAWVALVGRALVFDAEAAGLQAAVEHIPEDSTTQCLVDSRWSLVSELPAWDCTCSWAHLERGGVAGFMPHETGVTLREPWYLPPFAMDPWKDEPSRHFPYAERGNLYRWWLVRAPPDAAGLDAPALAPYFEPVFVQGPWRVYRRVRDFPAPEVGAP